MSYVNVNVNMNTAQLKCLVDADGILFNFCETYLKLLKELTGKEAKYEDITTFNFSASVATKDQDDKVWRHIDSTKGIVENLSLVEGAHDGINELRKLGKVICVTSPHIGDTWMPERYRALVNKFGFNKDTVCQWANKAEVPGDVIIEDKLSMCVEYKNKHPNATVILLDCPYKPRFRLWDHPSKELV